LGKGSEHLKEADGVEGLVGCDVLLVAVLQAHLGFEGVLGDGRDGGDLVEGPLLGLLHRFSVEGKILGDVDVLRGESSGGLLEPVGGIGFALGGVAALEAGLGLLDQLPLLIRRLCLLAVLPRNVLLQVVLQLTAHVELGVVLLDGVVDDGLG